METASSKNWFLRKHKDGAFLQQRYRVWSKSITRPCKNSS
jgi:hypothetical protein